VSSHRLLDLPAASSNLPCLLEKVRQVRPQSPVGIAQCRDAPSDMDLAQVAEQVAEQVDYELVEKSKTAANEEAAATEEAAASEVR